MALGREEEESWRDLLSRLERDSPLVKAVRRTGFEPRTINWIAVGISIVIACAAVIAFRVYAAVAWEHSWQIFLIRWLGRLSGVASVLPVAAVAFFAAIEWQDLRRTYRRMAVCSAAVILVTGILVAVLPA